MFVFTFPALFLINSILKQKDVLNFFLFSVFFLPNRLSCIECHDLNREAITFVRQRMPNTVLKDF